MNTFGRIFRIHIFGESHGKGVGVIIDGVPPGILIQENDLEEDLIRRAGLHQKGTTPRKELAPPQFLSGLFNQNTNGAPLTIFFPNSDIRPEDYESQRAIPRPGHADFVSHIKFKGFEDYRGGGHFSARLTTGVVAAGVIAKKILLTYFKFKNLIISASVTEVGGFKDIEKGLQSAIDKKDSVGGIVSGIVEGLPIGLGEPFWDSLESLLSHAFFAIPAVKGVSFGSGFGAAQMNGIEHNDSIINQSGHTQTNYAGGIVGGISNGNPLTFQIAFKPTSSTPQKQKSWNWETNQVEEFSLKGRHDLCVALRAPVIVEAMSAIVLADAAFIHANFNLNN